MSGNIVQLPQMLLVGMSYSGEFQTLGVEMPKLWEIFWERAGEIGHLKSALPVYGVSDESRVGSYRIYTEYLAVEVEKVDTIPVGMVGFTIPARRYAQFTHQGPMEQVQSSYRDAFAWLRQEGLELDEHAFRLERYDDRYLPPRHAADRPENAYDILLPLR